MISVPLPPFSLWFAGCFRCHLLSLLFHIVKQLCILQITKRLEFFLLWSDSMMMTHLRSADNAIKGKPDSQTLQRIGTFVAPAFKPPG